MRPNLGSVVRSVLNGGSRTKCVRSDVIRNVWILTPPQPLTIKAQVPNLDPPQVRANIPDPQ